MHTNQKKLLLSISKEARSRPKNREQVIASLASAKILTKNGHFTKHFANLGKAISVDK